MLAMASLPVGTVTFLFSDIEGSTRLLQRLGDRYEELLSKHRRVIRGSAADASGTEIVASGRAGIEPAILGLKVPLLYRAVVTPTPVPDCEDGNISGPGTR
jgi:class 3 adenylate cyclase